jgi:hypothetical protein
MLVCWGARAGDVQAGSWEDRCRQRTDALLLAACAPMAQNAARVFKAMPTAVDVAAEMRKSFELWDRASVKVGER